MHIHIRAPADALALCAHAQGVTSVWLLACVQVMASELNATMEGMHGHDIYRELDWHVREWLALSRIEHHSPCVHTDA